MSPPSTRLRARALSPALRALVAAACALAALIVLDLGAGLLADAIAPGEVERVPLPLLARRLLVAALLGAGAAVIHWLVGAEVEVGDETVAIRGRWTGWEVPRASIAAARPWRLAWPGPGVSLALTSGRTFRRVLSMPDPTPLVAALGGDTDHPRLVAARARRATRWLRHPLHALVLAPLVPTAIVFRLHQIITTGSWLGEYRWYGLERWLYTLSGVWLLVAGTMLCWYAAWRVAVALVAWPAARLGERRARAVRWAAEAIALAGYYGGVAWLLASRLGE
jgi:apolipoprotein N-acyltransferase